MAEAAEQGYNEIAITDRNSLAGIVRAHSAAKKKGMRIIVGCRLDLLDGPSLLVYPTGSTAYSRLCTLLTRGNLRAEKGECHLYKQDVYEFAEGFKIIAIPPSELNEHFEFDSSFKIAIAEYRKAFGAELYLAVTRHYFGDDAKQIFRLTEISNEFRIPLVATNDVHYHNPDRRKLQDVVNLYPGEMHYLQCRFRLHENAERHLKPPEEMLRLFRQYPDAINRTQEISDACQFTLDSLKYEYPEEITSEGRTPTGRINFSCLAGC